MMVRLLDRRGKCKMGQKCLHAVLQRRTAWLCWCHASSYDVNDVTADTAVAGLIRGVTPSIDVSRSSHLGCDCVLTTKGYA